MTALDGTVSAVEEPPDQDASVPRRARWPDVVGVLWVVLAGIVALVPTYVRGRYFGAYDFLSTYGITLRPGTVVHNAAVGDIGDQVVPWLQMAWSQVHSGHLPLWNRYEALGMPLAFNWGSGAFSFAALVSYLVPLKAAYWTQILITVVVGGTGAYFFARLLRLHPVACAFAGTTWILSGPFFGYLGLPDTATMSWAGWQFAAVLLILRGTRRYWSVVLLAVSLAFSILAGNPQIELVILLALVVFALVMLVSRVSSLGGSGPIRRPTVDLAIGAVAGAALSAPLSLPGLQLASMAVRNTSSNTIANPVSQVLGTVFQSFWGLPIKGSWVNRQGFYPEQWVWVGAIALVLAVVAVGVRWRRPEVVALAAAAVVTCAASIFEPVDKALNALPLIGHAWWSRALIPLAFCLAILAAVGLDAVLRPSERRAATRWALWGSAGLAVVLLLVWAFGRGHLPAYAAHIRADSFIWPLVSTVFCLSAFGFLAVLERRRLGERWAPRRSQWLALGLLGSLLTFQTVYLIVDDAPLPSSSSTPYQPTPAVTALQHAVGSSLVGVGEASKEFGGLGLGLGPNYFVVFGIHEFAEYDPIAPTSFFSTWFRFNHSSDGLIYDYDFLPAITNATVARRYGISYVLGPAGAPGPTGAVFVTRVDDEELYRIPGSAQATLVPASSGEEWPSVDASGRPVSMTWTSPSAVRVVTDSASPTVLRLRLTSLPGWQATIDGQPLATSPYLSMMLQAHIPAGRHVIELSYWPKRFTAGIVIATVTVVAMVVVGVIGHRRRRRGDGEMTDVESTPLAS